MASKSPAQPAGSRGGLTLVDVLFALAIISTVTALLWPTIHRSPAQVRQFSCATDMKQLGLASLQYEQDNDGCLPPKVRRMPQAWAGRIYPYVRNPILYRCPDDPTAPYLSAVPISFAMNQNLSGSATYLSQPASTVLLFEVSGVRVDVSRIDEGSGGWKVRPASSALSPCGNGLPTANRGYPSGAWGRGAPTITYATGDMAGRGPLNGGDGSTARHPDGANFLGADGHVRHLQPEQVSTGTYGKRGNFQDHRRAGRAASTDRMYLSDGKTPVLMTFSGT